jgi:virginiamycin B lyase
MLVRFDPGSRKMQTFTVPGGGGTIRHMVVGRNDELWLAESGVGRIARVRWTARD